jgi:hypothetical protein
LGEELGFINRDNSIILKHLAMNDFKINPRRDVQIAAVAPCPVLMCPDQRAEIIADDLEELSMCYGIEAIHKRKRLLQYRGVALGRLPTILRTGIDTEPAHGVFWSSDRIDKAIEFGGPDKVLLVFDRRRLKPAWVILDRKCPREERREVERAYPTVVWETEQSTKLSRLPANEYHGGIGYDDYAYWIPDDPFGALMLIIAVAPPECRLVSEVLRMIGECSETAWKTGTAGEKAVVLKRATDRRRLKRNKSGPQ